MHTWFRRSLTLHSIAIGRAFSRALSRLRRFWGKITLVDTFKSAQGGMLGSNKLNLEMIPWSSSKNQWNLEAYCRSVNSSIYLYSLLCIYHFHLCRNRITQKLVFDLVAQEYYLTKAQVPLFSTFTAVRCTFFWLVLKVKTARETMSFITYDYYCWNY
jgi:hypothetical protein